MNKQYSFEEKVEMIARCALYILVVTENTFAEAELMEEVALAMEFGKPFYVIRQSGAYMPPEFLASLPEYQYVEFQTDSEYRFLLQQIMEQMKIINIEEA